MEGSDRKEASSDSSLKTSAPEECAVPETIITYHLRDREMLRKRKAEAQERNSIQWVTTKQERKQQTRDQPKRACRGRGGRSRLVAAKPELEPIQELEYQPSPQVEDEPTASVSAPPEPMPVLTIKDVMAETESGAVEGMLAARSQDLTGEEGLLAGAEAEMPEGFNIPLENVFEDEERDTPDLL